MLLDSVCFQVILVKKLRGKSARRPTTASPEKFDITGRPTTAGHNYPPPMDAPAAEVIPAGAPDVMAAMPPQPMRVEHPQSGSTVQFAPQPVFDPRFGAVTSSPRVQEFPVTQEGNPVAMTSQTLQVRPTTASNIRLE